MTGGARPMRRIARVALAVLFLVAFVQGLRGTFGLREVARAARPMCEGLPDYAELAAAVPVVSRVAVEVDRAEARAAERFVCARLALAPRPVVAKVEGEPPIEGPPPEYVLIDRGSGAGLEGLP